MLLRLLFAVLACGLTAWIVDAADIPLPRAVFPRSPAPRERRIDPIPAPRPARVIAAAPVPRNFDMPVPRHVIAPFIDHHIDAAIAEAGVTPAAQADDATLIRRLTLDLVGRIPTTREVDAYVKSTDPDKRAKLVDRLIASPGVRAAPGRAVRGDVQPRGQPPRRRPRSATTSTSAVREGKPWDRIFRELMLPDETDAKLKGAAEFLRGRVADADKLTNDVSVAFFGVNVSCAQCHDHPHVADWTQDHFYGMKTFLARTFDNGGFLGERGYGAIKYKPTKGPERTAKMMFLTGTVIEEGSGKEPSAEEKKKEKAALDKAKAAKTAAAGAEVQRPGEAGRGGAEGRRTPSSSPGTSSTGCGTASSASGWSTRSTRCTPRTRRATRNCSTWLARDIAAHGYDLRRLIRGIVMSKAYSRSSKYRRERRRTAKLFAVAKLKPLTPMQLATSLKIAATDPATLDGKKPDEVEKKLEQTGVERPRVRGAHRPADRQLPDRRRRGAAVQQRRPRDEGVPDRRRRTVRSAGSRPMKDPKRGGRVPGEDRVRPSRDRRGVEGARRRTSRSARAARPRRTGRCSGRS